MAVDLLDPALERFGNRIVQEGPRPGERRELRDPGAHRAGAGDADRFRWFHEGGESNVFVPLYIEWMY